MNGVDIDRAQGQGPGRGNHKPRVGSLRQQLRLWFEANPGELLTFDDIAAKFDVSRAAAVAAVETLRAEGLVYSAVMVGLDPDRGR
jgi:DNA-binding GntR family transcriptional regulator